MKIFYTQSYSSNLSAPLILWNTTFISLYFFFFFLITHHFTSSFDKGGKILVIQIEHASEVVCACVCLYSINVCECMHINIDMQMYSVDKNIFDRVKSVSFCREEGGVISLLVPPLPALDSNKN